MSSPPPVNSPELDTLRAELERLLRAQIAQTTKDADVLQARMAVGVEKDWLRGPVEAVLKAANGRASSFATATYQQVLDLADRGEAALEHAGIPKAHRAGARLQHTGAGPASTRYNYTSAGTSVELRRDASGVWHLLSAARTTLHPKQGERFTVAISKAARDDVVRIALAPFSVLREEGETE